MNSINNLQNKFEFQNPVSRANNRKKVVKTIVKTIATSPVPEQSDYKKGFKEQYNQDSAPPDLQGSTGSTGSTVQSTLVKSLPTSQHIKISVRLPRGIVTSLTIKKNIIAIWILYRTPLKSDPEQVVSLIEEGLPVKEDTIKEMVTRFVYRSLNDWDHDTGKGLSDFVTELMIEDALEMEDHSIYQMIMSHTKA